MKRKPVSLSTRALGELAAVSESRLRKLLKVLCDIVDDPVKSDRSKMGACRAIAQIRRLNLDAIKTSLIADDRDVQHELEELKRRISEIETRDQQTDPSA